MASLMSRYEHLKILDEGLLPFITWLIDLLKIRSIAIFELREIWQTPLYIFADVICNMEDQTRSSISKFHFLPRLHFITICFFPLIDNSITLAYTKKNLRFSLSYSPYTLYISLLPLYSPSALPTFPITSSTLLISPHFP